MSLSGRSGKAASSVPRRVVVSWCRGGRLGSDFFLNLFRRLNVFNKPICPLVKIFSIPSFSPPNMHWLLSDMCSDAQTLLLLSSKAFPVYYTVPDLLLFTLFSLANAAFVWIPHSSHREAPAAAPRGAAVVGWGNGETSCPGDPQPASGVSQT